MKVQLQLGRSALVFLVLLMIPCMASLALADGDITSGLIGYWKLDEGTGTVAYDNSSSGYDGDIIGGMFYADGKFGYGLNGTDGLEGYVNVTESTTYDLGENPFSVSVWFKGVKYDNNHGSIGSLWSWTNTDESVNNSAECEYITLGVRMNGGELQVSPELLDYTGNDARPFGTYYGNLSDANWHNIVTTINWTGNMTMWVDDVQLLTQDISDFVYGDNDGNFRISNTFGGGACLGTTYNTQYGSLQNGTVDEVRVYDRILSSDDIASVYAYAPPTTTTTTSTTVPTTTTTISAPTGEIVDRNVNVIVTLLVVFMVAGIALIIKDQFV